MPPPDKLAAFLYVSAASATFLAGRSVDDILDARDADPFSAEWSRVLKLVAAVGAYRDLSAYQELEDSLSEAIFKLHDSFDLAAYMSEDFGLLVRAIAFAVEDPWLSGLLTQYVRRVCPCGELPLSSVPLSDLLASIEESPSLQDAGRRLTTGCS